MKLKLSFLFAFISIYCWSQTTQTFNANGTFSVPAGVTSLSVQAWGGAGAGGGATGAGLLLGRAGAGGGGGAFASAPITVTPGTVLNIVVAGQTPGTTGANGAAGGSSTITGFESSILAAGGSGGGGNNAGGTPLGGSGGTVAASAGTTRLAGGNGGNGSSSLLSLLLTSGSGGGGANAGGVGGAGISSLILGNGPGNAGTAPGGAGSGAINSAGGASQIGGAGGAGRLTITYTCTAYNLTSTTASSFCADSGTTSTVSLTGSAVSLPVGNYVVTYNRSNPSGTALTANMTVSTAGTGTFTAVGLTNTGSSIITITKLTSGTCISNITTNNTATVTISPTSVGGTVSGGTSICSGSTSGVLTLSGNVGAVVKWQFAVSPFTTWTDVPNPSTANTYTSTALTETTQFRVVVGGGFCSDVNSGAATVTVSPEPLILFNNPDPSVCLNNNSSAFVFFGYPFASANLTTYSIVWDPSPVNSFAAVNNEALPENGAAISVEVPAGTAPETYTGTLTVKDANGCVSSGIDISITVSPVPSIQLENDLASVCADSNSQVATIYYSGTQGNPVTYDIYWDSGLFTNVSDEALPASDDPIEIIVPGGIPAGIYTGTLTVINATGCVSSGTEITIAVSPEPSIQMDTVQGYTCINSTESSVVNFPYYGAQGAYSYTIDWSSNALPDVVEEKLPGVAGEIPVTIPAGTPEGTYTGRVTVASASGCIGFVTVITMDVYTAPEINHDPILVACSDAEYATSALALSSNIPIASYAIIWDSESLPFQADTPFHLEMDNVIVPPNTPEGTYTGIIYFSTDRCGGHRPITLKILTCEELLEASGSEENNVSIHALNKVLNIDSSHGNINQVYVYDVSGNLVYKKERVSDSKLEINNLRSGNQVLIVKVVLDNNKVETKKVVY